MMVSMSASASAVSVPGRSCTVRLPGCAPSHVMRGSMQMKRVPIFIMSMSACPNRPSPLEYSGILPQHTTYLGSSNSGLSKRSGKYAA